MYKVKFSRLGENLLTVNFGAAQYMILEFFVTESLETLIKKRAAFLVAKQLHRDPSKWYNGLFSDWDMKAKTLRGPDDKDGLKDYWWPATIPACARPPTSPKKTQSFPPEGDRSGRVSPQELRLGEAAVHEQEKYPYGIYGIDNWKINRESKPADRRGWTEHVWRVYDYPHMILLYLEHVPDRQALSENGEVPGPGRVSGTGLRDGHGVLHRAHENGQWYAYQVGNYDELVIVDLIEELDADGWKDRPNRCGANGKARSSISSTTSRTCSGPK